MASYTSTRKLVSVPTDAFARVILTAGVCYYCIAYDVDNLFQRTNSRWRGPFGNMESAVEGAEKEAEDMGVELTWIGPTTNRGAQCHDR